MFRFRDVLVMFALLSLSISCQAGTIIGDSGACFWFHLDACQHLSENLPPTLLENAIEGDEDISLLLQGRATLSMYEPGNQSDGDQSVTDPLHPKQPQHGPPGFGNESKTTKQLILNSISVADRKHIAIMFCYTVLVAAFAMRGCCMQNTSIPNSPAQPREKHWDVAKAFFMWLVVCDHIALQSNDNTIYVRRTLLYNMVLRFEMPGFSFVSGIMAASGVRSNASQNTSLQQNSKLMNRVRDLILPNFTCSPFVYAVLLAVSLLAGSKQVFLKSVHQPPSVSSLLHDIFTPPFLLIPGHQIYWFLIALFVWNLLAPTICLLRLPILTSMLVSLVCGEIFATGGNFNPNTTIGLFVFFVTGFHLAGGGLSTEECSASRERLENQFRSNIARIAATMLLIIWVICMTYSRIHSGDVPSFARNGSWFTHTKWIRHGVAIDALSLLIDGAGVICIIVVCFALPDRLANVAASIGSRSLYVYLLHLVIVSDSGNCHLMKAVSNPTLGVLLVLIQGVWVSAVLGSALTQNLTRPFVQPQWLIHMLFVAPKQSKDIET